MHLYTNYIIYDIKVDKEKNLSTEKEDPFSFADILKRADKTSGFGLKLPNEQNR